VLTYEALRLANVEATRELLRLAATGVRKAFHFVSTTFIFGWTTQRLLAESDRNDDMSNLDFGYAQSKWVAEQLVFAAGRQGLPVRVYRPSIVSASTRGAGNRDDIAVRLLGFMIGHGLAIKALNQISLLPVDVAADNLISIIGQPGPAGHTFHVTAERYYNLVDITRIITRDHGYSFAYHDIPGFVAALNRECRKDEPLYPLLDFFNRSQGKLTAMEHKRYASDGYRTALSRCPDARPEPTLRDTVAYVMTYLREAGLVSEPATQVAC
jgi:thioester reductase-like protein